MNLFEFAETTTLLTSTTSQTQELCDKSNVMTELATTDNMDNDALAAAASTPYHLDETEVSVTVDIKSPSGAPRKLGSVQIVADISELQKIKNVQIQVGEAATTIMNLDTTALINAAENLLYGNNVVTNAAYINKLTTTKVKITIERLPDAQPVDFTVSVKSCLHVSSTGK